MKKPFVFFFLIVVLASTYFGLKKHFGMVATLPKEIGDSQVQKKLKQLHPILEDQMIVAIVLGENNLSEVERNLSSLFDQTYPHHRIIYVDNGSTDGTYEKVKELGAGKKIEIIRHEEKRAILEILYSLIGKCDSHEIIALIEGKDWLSHENVFDHLNCAYANPDVWMTYSRAISHPNYQVVDGELFSDQAFLEKTFRRKERKVLSPLMTFYAGFFQEIQLQDLLYEGKFIDECIPLTLQLPLLEMGPDHILFMDEVSYVKNIGKEIVDHKLHLQKVAAVESHLRSLHSNQTLSHLSLGLNNPSLHRYKADIVLFSEDSPLHLYAFLESLFAKARDINEVYVLYKGGDHEFQRAYLNLQNEFHTVHFLNVCDYPGNDYATLITKVLEDKRHASPFVVFGTDQWVFEEKVRFHDAIKAMERVHADHFFINLEEGNQEILPTTIPINEGIYAYQLGAKGAEQPFVLALCRKSLFQHLESVSDLPSFKKLWQKKLSPMSVVLFYEEKKTLPLNITHEPSSSQKKQWGHKFIEGFKIDLPSLTCEMEEVEKGEFPLIKRERYRPVTAKD